MKKIEIHEGYNAYDQTTGKFIWVSMGHVFDAEIPETFDFNRVSCWMDGDKLFIEGIIQCFDEFLNALEYTVAGVGCECDGCRQGECTSEHPCTWCSFSSEPTSQYFSLPNGTVLTEVKP